MTIGTIILTLPIMFVLILMAFRFGPGAVAASLALACFVIYQANTKE